MRAGVQKTRINALDAVCGWGILAVKLFEREEKLIIQEKYGAGMEGFLEGRAADFCKLRSGLVDVEEGRKPAV